LNPEVTWSRLAGIDRSHARIALKTRLIFLVWLSACISSLAQNASSEDRNAVNTAAAVTGMKRDSPVTFPVKKKFNDLRTKVYESEEGYIIFDDARRSLEQIAVIQAEMPKGEFTPPLNDWKYLPRTHRALKEGGEFHLLSLGDSIINDTSRSGWIVKLQEAFPKTKIRGSVYIRGGGSCKHYQAEGRVQKYIVPLKPDVVLIGGISQAGVAPIREVILQIRAGLPDVEIILATGVFGGADPRSDEEMAVAPHSGTAAYGKELAALAEEQKCAYLDLTTPWMQYIRSSKLHPYLFYRDEVHANEYGEQIISKIMLSYWTQP